MSNVINISSWIVFLLCFFGSFIAALQQQYTCGIYYVSAAIVLNAVFDFGSQIRNRLGR
jgi:hypothetical protein